MNTTSPSRSESKHRPDRHTAREDTSAETVREFKRVVNLSASRLEKWLQTEESRQVGWAHGDGRESVGHRSGRHIVRLLNHRQAGEVSAEDLAHMKKVIGYVHRHLAQRPQGDIEHLNWRYSLMNWGHDPLKD